MKNLIHQVSENNNNRIFNRYYLRLKMRLKNSYKYRSQIKSTALKVSLNEGNNSLRLQFHFINANDWK